MVLTTTINQKEMKISLDEFPELELAYCSSLVLDDTRLPYASKEAAG